MMFVTAGPHIYARDPETGEIVFLPDQGDIAPSNLFKGIAVGGGMVFYGTADAHVVALNEKTGEQIWSVPIGDSLPVRGRITLRPHSPPPANMFPARRPMPRAW